MSDKRDQLVKALQGVRRALCGDPDSDPADTATLRTIADNAAAVQAVLTGEARSDKVVLCSCGKPVGDTRLRAGATTCRACTLKAMQEPVPQGRVVKMLQQIRASDAKKVRRAKKPEKDPGAW